MAQQQQQLLDQLQKFVSSKDPREYNEFVQTYNSGSDVDRDAYEKLAEKLCPTYYQTPAGQSGDTDYNGYKVCCGFFNICSGGGGSSGYYGSSGGGGSSGSSGSNPPNRISVLKTYIENIGKDFESAKKEFKEQKTMDEVVIFFKAEAREEEKEQVKKIFDEIKKSGKKSDFKDLLKPACDKFYDTTEGKSRDSKYFGYKACCDTLDICPSDSATNEGLATWMIILIAVGGLAFLAIVAAAVFFFLLKKKTAGKRNKAGKEEVIEENNEETKDGKDDIEISIDED